jgi:hypothetical protein
VKLVAPIDDAPAAKAGVMANESLRKATDGRIHLIVVEPACRRLGDHRLA